MNLKTKIKRFFRIIRNICVNLSRIIFSKSEESSLFLFLSRYKYIIAIAIVLIVFISKNVFLIGKYTKDINSYKETISLAEAQNKQLKEDLKYYNTDEFVYRYAMSELNMRPTKESNLVHVNVFPALKEKVEESQSTDDTSSEHESEDKKDSTSNTEDSTQENNDSTNTENATEDN